MLKQVFTLFLLILAMSFSYADSNGVWTYSEDIVPGVVAGDESSNPTDSFTFNNELVLNQRSTFNNVINSNSQIGIGVFSPVYPLEVAGVIEGSSFVDFENNTYLINPLGESVVQRIRSDVYYSRGSNIFYVDPKDYSNLNDVNVEGIFSLNNVDIYDIFVEEGQADSITSDMIVDGTITTNDIDVANFSNLFATRELVNSSIQSISLNGSSVWSTNGVAAFYNAGPVGISTSSPSSGLQLDVEGRIGAQEFCDENGANCYSINQLVNSSFVVSLGGRAIIDQIVASGRVVDPISISATGDKWPDYIVCERDPEVSWIMYLNRVFENSAVPAQGQIMYTGQDTAQYYIFNYDGSVFQQVSLPLNCGAPASDIDSICDDGRCGFLGSSSSSSILDTISDKD